VKKSIIVKAICKDVDFLYQPQERKSEEKKANKESYIERYTHKNSAMDHFGLGVPFARKSYEILQRHER